MALLSSQSLKSDFSFMKTLERNISVLGGGKICCFKEWFLLRRTRGDGSGIRLEILQPILNSFYFQEVVQDEEILWIIDIIDKTTVVIFSIEYGLRWSSCQAGGRWCCPSGCSAARSRPSSSWRRWTWSTSSPCSPSTSPSSSSPSRTSATSARRARSSVWSRSPETKTKIVEEENFWKNWDLVKIQL